MSLKAELLSARALLARWIATCGQEVWRPTRQITQETRDFLAEQPVVARTGAAPRRQDHPLLNARQLTVLRAVASAPEGLTSAETETELHDRHQSVSARLNELRAADLVAWNGVERRTPSGRKAKVHTITPHGKKLLNS